jgi:Zn-dependent protease with chaperone function
MAMTHEEFEALVGRLEAQARAHPVGYKLRVLLLALLGFGYLGVAVVVLLVLFVAALFSLVYLKALAVKLIIPIGAFLWVVLRALWITLEPPQGQPVRRREAPALFALVDKLQRTLGAPRFHDVLVTDDFNAGVVQIPRLGMLGWHRNYLLLGLPLMKSLTPAQFEAVLAHELGHLAGGHGRLSNWLYRLRLSWGRLLAALEGRKAGSWLFLPFFHWYAPYFSAYSFPLARANEYEADATSVRLASSRDAAAALTSVNVIGTYLGERFWPEILKRSNDVPRPSFAPFAHMSKGMACEIDPEAARAWLDQAMARTTTVDDTHPSLADRLKAIGEAPHLAPPAEGEAADRLLGELAERITAEFDERWQQSILPSWKERYEESQNSRKRLAELDAKAAAQPELSLQEAYDRAMLTDSVGAAADAALEQLRALHARAPDEPVVRCALGARLLLRDDETGFALVEQAMQADESLIVAACETLRDHCWRKDRKEEAHVWHARMVERQQSLAAAQAERERILTSDKFDPHGLPADAIAGLRHQLAAVAGLRKAYLVRKRLRHFPERPQFILGHVVSPWWWFHNRKRAADVQQRIVETLRFPGEALIISLEGHNRGFGRKFRFIRGARIF